MIKYRPCEIRADDMQSSACWECDESVALHSWIRLCIDRSSAAFKYRTGWRRRLIFNANTDEESFLVVTAPYLLLFGAKSALINQEYTLVFKLLDEFILHLAQNIILFMRI